MNETIYIYLIPLTNVPQTFQINLGGTNYTLTAKWNDMAESWYLDIGDANGNPLACGIPFTAGEALTTQLEYLGIDGDLYVFTTGEPDAVPTLDNLGTASNLYYTTTLANNGG
jgi:hypothetical protein